MNKLITISILAALFMAACTSTPSSYVIEGVAPDDLYNDQIVYMIDMDTRDIVDSAVVVSRKFTFTGWVETPVVQQFKLAQISAPFILENGNIKVDLSNPKGVRGTPLNDELSKYLTVVSVAQEERDAKLAEIAELEDDERRSRMETIVRQYRENVTLIATRIFNANKNNALGALVLLDSSTSLEPDLFDALFAQGGEVVQNFSRLQTITVVNEGLRNTAEGKHFVDFTIENGAVDSSSVSLSDFVGKGKYVLVDFWASWCGPCIVEKPVLVDVFNEHVGDEFDMVGVAVWDKREDTLNAIETHNIEWTQIIDTGTIPSVLYGIRTIPQIILFGPDGTIIARNLRGNALKAKIAEVLCECN